MVSVAASEFWTKATRCETTETLHALFLTFAQALGFHSAMFINLSNAGGPVLPRVVLGDMDPWIAYYTEQNFARLDPTIPMAFRSRTPFTWRRRRAAGRAAASAELLRRGAGGLGGRGTDRADPRPVR